MNARPEVQHEDRHECPSWYAGMVTCMVCSHEWAGVWCNCANVKALECPACGLFAGMPDPPAR